MIATLHRKWIHTPLIALFLVTYYSVVLINDISTHTHIYIGSSILFL